MAIFQPDPQIPAGTTGNPIIDALTGAVTQPGNPLLRAVAGLGSPGGGSGYAPGWMGHGHAPGLASGGKQFYGAQAPGPVGRGPGNWVWDGWGGSWRSDWVGQDPYGRWLVSGEN